ncbi:aminotransferase class I/II-fold pyridoxal phosphate-dependent enzyme [Hymenobacter sp. 15J16-1T3B]|uniref:aminotransferase class I/II-fold pyridoxal phosphate-dependent enzyme n=1 Tax=Hymenobacter sp. 15J16-1T3B TaxID=2886941 RepID=UPI001D103B43|nr:aminotransferase class I/II-fold pyridoxal phosphate-dependent enzyme [Hymenobacter sp. 15J16-1T3B]MCC3156143.1 aminotransferase class I/II-fold pyridoxal phosphate-dependent enzyme [Hymenobacter sp. 15J16-1T3B]
MLKADSLPGRTLLAPDGRQYLYCSGTGYLGTARNPAFAALLAEGLSRYGTNYGASRHGPLQLRVYDEAEAYLAEYVGLPAALTVSSGYLAGQMAVKALARAGRFEYAPGTHPAAWITDHPAPVGSTRSFADWARHLLRRLQHETPQPVVIVANSLDPLRVQRYDFQWTRELPTDRPVTLLIDDSHGLGVIGPDGAGIRNEIEVPGSVRLVVVSSLAKACGVPGGAVLAEARFIEELRRSAFFGASSPVVPAYLYAFLQAQELYREARAQLTANTRLFQEATAGLGLFQSAPDFPVFYALRPGLAAFMEEQDVLISSLNYPTPDDAPITRVVLSALHTSDDVARVAALAAAFAATTLA